MFTPQEVSEKVFPKSSGLSSGYQMAAVDQFLDSLTEDYTSLYKENVTLKAKLKILAEKVEEYRATEDSMRAALMTAQKMASKLVQEAQQERAKIIKDAALEAKMERERYERENRAVEQRLAEGQQKLSQFIRSSRELCVKQAQFLEQLPKMEVTDENEPAPQDTVDNIGKDILLAYTQDEESTPVVEEESDHQILLGLPEETEQLTIDDTTDMTKIFNLDDLKFGRNYTGE